MKFIILIALSLFAIQIHALNELKIPAEVQDALRKDGEFVRYFFADSSPLYIPDTQMQPDIIDRYRNLSHRMGVEVYFTLPRNKQINPEDTNLQIYNLLRRISKLEGIEYYSQSRKRMRTFFRRAYVVSEPGNPKRLPDPVFDTLPGWDSMYILQEDLTFGENYSEAIYEYQAGIVTLTIVNRTVMRYIFPLIPEEGLLMTIQILAAENEFIFYGLCGVDMVGFLGMERSRKESFYNRLKAMYNWFAAEIDTLKL